MKEPLNDIDLRIIVSEGKLDDFIQSKRQLPHRWGEVLFIEDFYPKSNFTIVHFVDFIKVDVFFYKPSTIQPSIWLKGIKSLYDPHGIVNELSELSEQITFKVTPDEVLIWRGKVFSYIHEVYRRTRREEYYYALSMINNLRAFIVNGWNMEADRHSNEAWDWSKIEGARSALETWQLDLLASWTCGRSQDEIMKTLMSMIPEITRLHMTLCAKTGIEDVETLDRVLSLVL